MTMSTARERADSIVAKVETRLKSEATGDVAFKRPEWLGELRDDITNAIHAVETEGTEAKAAAAAAKVPPPAAKTATKVEAAPAHGKRA